jgi:hypothetical protein
MSFEMIADLKVISHDINSRERYTPIDIGVSRLFTIGLPVNGKLSCIVAEFKALPLSI